MDEIEINNSNINNLNENINSNENNNLNGNIDDNHNFSVDKNDYHCSEKTLNSAKDALIDYIRDVKGPKGKRSIAHLYQYFCKEGKESKDDNGQYGASRKGRFKRFAI